MSLRKRWWITGLLALCLLVGMARDLRADEVAVLMTATGMQGHFTQRITNADGDDLGTSKGQFALLRPHFFKWEIASPGSQLIVSDGTYLWQYDRDLETISRRDVAGAGTSPLQLLALDPEILRRDYIVETLDEGLRLIPRQAPALFQRLDIVLKQGVPSQLYVIDNLDQQLSIVLTVDDDLVPAPSDFAFTPPENIELTIVDGSEVQ